MKRSQMFNLTTLLLVLAALSLSGCADKGTGPADDHNGTEELAFALAFSTSSLETLEPVSLSLTVTDHHGESMMNIEGIEIQYRMEGATMWESISMAPGPGHYEGTHMFVTSGEYEMRVMGESDHGDGHGHGTEELHHMAEHYRVLHAHVNSGGYRVEYESFPGQIHTDDTATLTFWVTDDVSGNAIDGLSPSIRCFEADGTEHMDAATESAAGVYELDHVILSPGATAISLRFTGTDLNPAEGLFNVMVSAGH